MNDIHNDDVMSSPIVNRDDDAQFSLDLVDDFEDHSTHKRKNYKRGPKIEIEDPNELNSWSEAKRTAWTAIKTNPNAFFYRHVAPGVEKRNGAWTKEEKELFMKAMEVHPPSTGKWGLFAQLIPGRVGYQCRNFYHRLIQTKEIVPLPGELEKLRRKKHITEKPKKTPKTSKKSHSYSRYVDSDDTDEISLSDELSNAEKDSSSENDDQIQSEPSDNEDYEGENISPIPSNTYNNNPSLKEENEDQLVQSIEEKEEVPIPQPLIWSPTMEQPWRTIKNTSKPVSFIPKPFTTEVSLMETINAEHPLNYLLFSIPVPNDRELYLKKVRELMVTGQQEILDQMIRLYMKISSQIKHLEYEKQKPYWNEYESIVMTF